MYMVSVSIMCKLSHIMFMVVTSNTFTTLHIPASPLVCKDTEENQLYECNDNCAQDYYTVSFCETYAQSIHISRFISQLYFHSMSLCECYMVITVRVWSPLHRLATPTLSPPPFWPVWSHTLLTPSLSGLSI